MRRQTPFTRCTVLLAAGLVVLTAGLSSVGAQDAAAEPGPAPKRVAEFDMPKDGSLVVLPLTFQGKTYRFLVDTGSRYTTFDESFASLLGEPKGVLEGESRDGEKMTLRIFYAPDATVGPLNLKQGGPVMCVDLTELRRLSGLDVHGVLGMGLLRRYAMQMDVDAGKLRFYEPVTGEQPAWGEAIAIRMQNAVPVLRGSFGGKFHALFAVHTGYEYSGALGRRFFKSLQASGMISKVARTMVGTTVDDSSDGIAARIDDFRVGPFTLNSMIFDSNPEEVSLLGMGWLRRFNATFDFRNSRLYLRKSHLFDLQDQQDMSGLHLVQAEKGAKVHSVDADSPAARAGIKPGDVILQLNKKWVVQMSLAEARRMLRSGDGKEIEVVFQRGEQGYRTTLTLKQQI